MRMEGTPLARTMCWCIGRRTLHKQMCHALPVVTHAEAGHTQRHRGVGLDNQRSTYSGYRTSQAPTSRGSQGSGYPRGVQQSRVAPNVPRPPTLSARAQSPTFGQRSSSGFGSRGYSVAPQTQARSSGLHGFGSGQRSASFHAPKSESFHAPKMKAPKSYGGGHSGGGGHFGGGHSGGGGKHHH